VRHVPRGLLEVGDQAVETRGAVRHQLQVEKDDVLLLGQRALQVQVLAVESVELVRAQLERRLPVQQFILVLVRNNDYAQLDMKIAPSRRGTARRRRSPGKRVCSAEL